MTDHAHHWRIQEPSGPTVEGRCKLCGARRTYQTWEPINDDYAVKGRNGKAASMKRPSLVSRREG